MERLTKRSEDGTVKYNHDSDGHGIVWDSMILDRLAAYEDAEGEERLIVFESAEKRKHIQELAEADKDGRCVVLPCKIGDTIFVVGYKYRAGKYDSWINTGKFEINDLDRFGKTVFLTREAAEAAKAALKAGDNR